MPNLDEIRSDLHHIDNHLICVKQHKKGTENIPEDTTIHDRDLRSEKWLLKYI